MKLLSAFYPALLVLSIFFSNSATANALIKAVEYDTTSAHYYFKKAQFYQHRKDYNAAIEELKKAITLGDTLALEANLQLGNLYYYESQNPTAAITSYTQALAIDAQNHRGLANRGLCYYKTGQFESAVSDFNAALNAEATDSKLFFHESLTNIDITYYRAESNIELKNYDKALSDLNSVIAEQENYVNAYFARAFVYYQKSLLPHEKHKKDLDLALADYNKVAKLDPTFEAVYFDRGLVKMELNDYNGAISDFKKAIANNPADLDAKYEKAMCNYHFGYSDIALAEFEEIIQQDSSYINAAYQIGVICYENGSYAIAIDALKKVLAYDKEHSDVYYYLGLSYLEIDNKQAACENLTVAENLGDTDAHHVAKSKCPK